MHFLIVTGMSGAGKSRTVATLEDLGYYCVDNLPLALIPQFAEVCFAATERYDRVALVTDVRAGGDFQQLFDSLDSIQTMGCAYSILFLDTDTDTLIHRYKETRRKHPLMKRGVSMPEAIEQERRMLAAVRERLIKIFSKADAGELMEIIVQSFGFKYGIPTEADLVFDVRFLPNPYYEISLREHNGTEKCVRDYVFQDGVADQLMEHLDSLVAFLLPRYAAEGKASLVIGIGCTGGKHRSVAIAETLAEHINRHGGNATAVHRDYQRG